MKVDDGAPADTSMMTIVHNALRRDLARARDRLAAPELVPAAQRAALGEHLGWLMDFLHRHHESEDEGLYRLVRERAAGSADDLAVFDRMASAHEAIAGAMVGVEAAGAALAVDPTADAALAAVDALDALSALLLPHLREEEDEAMPIVSRLITAGEWRASEREHNLDGKTKAQLGFEGHWLIDGVDATDRTTVLALVPPVPRFVLLHGFARRYRRHAERCWGAGPKPPRRVQLQNAVSVTVPADIDAVWAVLSDPTRVGEWSHECVGAAWLDGSERAVPGARFRGRNVAGITRWGRICEIESAAPYRMSWRTVPTTVYPDSSLWSIELEALDGGTRISQEFRVLRAPRVLGVVYALVIPDHRDRTVALAGDLRRLGEVAASRDDPRPRVLTRQQVRRRARPSSCGRRSAPRHRAAACSAGRRSAPSTCRAARRRSRWSSPGP